MENIESVQIYPGLQQHQLSFGLVLSKGQTKVFTSLFGALVRILGVVMGSLKDAGCRYQDCKLVDTTELTDCQILHRCSQRWLPLWPRILMPNVSLWSTTVVVYYSLQRDQWLAVLEKAYKPEHSISHRASLMPVLTVALALQLHCKKLTMIGCFISLLSTKNTHGIHNLVIKALT